MKRRPASGARQRVQTGARRRFAALLRGINVGGKNILPMQALAGMFREAGCGDVQTYIQSGNVIFTAEAACAQALPNAISAAVHAEFGFSPTLLIREAEQLRSVVARNPFKKRGDDPATLHVGFLAVKPARKRIAALDHDRSPGDRFVVDGQEIYLCLANGAGRSKLTNAYIDSTLATTSTIRNWRTVLKLAELVREAP